MLAATAFLVSEKLSQIGRAGTAAMLLSLAITHLLATRPNDGMALIVDGVLLIISLAFIATLQKRKIALTFTSMR